MTPIIKIEHLSAGYDGKQVLNAETDAQGNADLSVLAGGTYLVSIVVDGAVKTVKFVRK